jgi:hypothetical protein
MKNARKTGGLPLFCHLNNIYGAAKCERSVILKNQLFTL